MYFPLGAPSVYSQDVPTRPRETSQVSNDGVDAGALVGQGTLISDRVDESQTLGDEPTFSGQSPPSSQDSQLENDGTGLYHRGLTGLQASRNGHIFATITGDTITVWQTKAYGFNASLLVRPDAAIIVVHTTSGFLITYSLSFDATAQAYQLLISDDGKRHARRRSVNTSARSNYKDRASLWEGGEVIQEAIPRFRMVIKVDAGISKALALDQELVVATKRPAAVQCIRWTPDKSGSQTSTALLSKMEWMESKTTVSDIVYDRPMNMYVWVMADGRAYSVQRQAPKPGLDSKAIFSGHPFHDPVQGLSTAITADINSRFSTIALGCRDGSIWLYAVRDYSGGVNPIRHLQPSVSMSTTGALSTLVYSPDGYCLVAGYEHGWATWTVFGQAGASSFAADSRRLRDDGDQWLEGMSQAFWATGGSHLMYIGSKAPEIVVLEFARSALASNMSAANSSRCLLQTADTVMIYEGHHAADLTTISTDTSLWHQSQVPASYLAEQWPMRIAATSADGRYIAVAGNRGLAHYSVNSGRWKLFEDTDMQNAFRIRVYSRELPLERSVQMIPLNTPAINITASGDDTILVYTHENVLDHYIVTAHRSSIQLSKVGQIGLHGIIRAPARVRAVSWVVPEHQMHNGDPSKDVAVASVFVLVDGKLVLLQPSTDDEGNLRYDMRVIAHDVEYSFLARDCLEPTIANLSALQNSSTAGGGVGEEQPNSTLSDSLWLFDGYDVKGWTDVQNLLETATTEYIQDVSPSVTMSVDFYPISLLLQKGIIFGIEAELMQGHEANFSSIRLASRYDSPAALHLSHRYKGLPYFAHALEMLLHNVLDDEVENSQSADIALLPTVLSFLSSFPEYLDVVVQCTRKTELRSWRTLFDHLPPPEELFESSLQNGSLKTAAGYLLVLHTLSDIHSTSPQVLSLLRAARDAQDWELCKELARFLMALDESGTTLEQALQLMSTTPSSGHGEPSQPNGFIDGIVLDHQNAANGSAISTRP
ncbi:MAG: hypothetical protein Q9159_007012 [Coniocarpon cinnabarinum]